MQGRRRHYRQNKNNVSRKVREVEAWGQRGIYAIYSDFKLVYVGEAISSEGIGARLFAHHSKPQLHGRWDSFSWFGIDGYNADGKPVPYQPIKVTAPTIARTLELVAILVADPPMNRAQGRFKGAERIDQAHAKGGEPSVEGMLEMLKKVTSQLEGLKGK